MLSEVAIASDESRAFIGTRKNRNGNRILEGG